MAEQMKNLQEENERKLSELRKKKEEEPGGGIACEGKLTEYFMDVHDQLDDVKKEMKEKEAQWEEMYKALRDQLKERLVPEEKWLEEQKRTKEDINVLVDRIVYLDDLASNSDREKAQIKRAERKDQKEAAKAPKKQN